MKRNLRSAASKDDAENEPPTKSMKQSNVDPVSRARRRATVLKENKENVTKSTKNQKNNRRNVVQPLQEQNSVVIDENSHKANKPRLLKRTAEPESLSSEIEHIPTNSSKRKVRTESVENAKPMEDIVVNTKPQKPKPQAVAKAATTKNPVVSSMTTRNKKQSKGVQVDGEKLPATVQEVPTKSTRRNLDKPKSAGTKTPTKNGTLPPAVKTQSDVKSNEGSIPIVSPMRRTRRQLNAKGSSNESVMKTPAKKSAVVSTYTTRSAMKRDKVKTSPASNVTVRRNRIKKSSMPVVPNENMEPTSSTQVETQFVTTRKKSNRNQTVKSKAEENDKPKMKVPVVSNVTTRRRVPSDKLTEIKADSTISKTGRSQSVPRVIKEKVTLANSNIEGIEALPIPVTKQKTSHSTDQKIDQKVTKQPELSVNRSTASDSSDHSNGSTLPIYKRCGNTNNNTVDSVFDFESNSQDNTVENDEQMQELLAKLVREKKASVIKRKPKGQKGVTKAKIEAARSKKIEKIRSDLKQLKQLKELAPKVTVRKVDGTKAIPKPQVQKPHIENLSNDMPDSTSVIDLVDNDMPDNSNFVVDEVDAQVNSPVANDQAPEIDHVECSRSETNRQNEKESPRVDGNRIKPAPTTFVETMNAGPSKENDKFKRPFISSGASKATPPRQFQTYQATGAKKSDAFYQSTPVRIVPSGSASPWRYDAAEVKHTNNVFRRYTALEKSPIKSIDITKVVAADTNSPGKKMQRQPLATKSVSNIVHEAKTTNPFSKDLVNCFGFDEESEDADCLPRPSLPGVNTSISPKKTARTTKEASAPKSRPFFRIPEALNNIRDKISSFTNRKQDSSNMLNRNAKGLSSKPTLFEYPNLTTASIPSSFKGRTMTTSKKTSGGSAPKKSGPKSTTASSFFKGRDMTTSNKSVEPPAPVSEISTSYIDNDGLSLFETTWPERDDQTHRSYAKVTKREHKRQPDNKNIMTDDESEFGDTAVQKRGKRTKQKDDRLEEELRQFEEKTNSEFMDVDNFEMVMEKSVSISLV